MTFGWDKVVLLLLAAVGWSAAIKHSDDEWNDVVIPCVVTLWIILLGCVIANVVYPLHFFGTP